uniref:aldehyde dehydrogenase family protein n=5 Tax=Burkholderia TaxID=32008 RepID=UPI002ABDCE43
MMKIQNLIGGRHCDASAGRTFEKLAPATGDYVAAVPASSAEDVDRAARAAYDALHDDAWARAGGPARARWLLRLADLIERDGDALTQLLAVEQGRPLAEMRMMDI